MGKQIQHLGLTLLVMASATVASAYPTALLNMPIADILRHRETASYYGITGNERGVDPSYFHGAGLQLGLFDRAEIGVDTDFLGNTVVNGKLQLFDKNGFAVSVGCMNVKKEQEPDTYVVARYTLKDCRFHCGYIRNAQVNRGIFGLDFKLPLESTGTIEHWSGPNGYTWGSVIIPIPKANGLSLQIGVGLPNVSADGIKHQVVLNYFLKF